MEAACLTAAIIVGPRSLAVRVSRDAKVARMIAAGLGTILDDVDSCSLRTRWPNCGSGSLRASVAASLCDSRAMLDKYAHWSSRGSSVAGSRNSVVPCWRRLPLSGAAIRLPMPRPVWTSWEGNSCSGACSRVVEKPRRAGWSRYCVPLPPMSPARRRSIHVRPAPIATPPTPPEPDGRVRLSGMPVHRALRPLCRSRSRPTNMYHRQADRGRYDFRCVGACWSMTSVVSGR